MVPEKDPTQQLQIKESLTSGSLEHLDAIQCAIKETQAIEHTKNMAAREVDCALSALAALPDSEYKTALVDLAGFAIERDH